MTAPTSFNYECVELYLYSLSVVIAWSLSTGNLPSHFVTGSPGSNPEHVDCEFQLFTKRLTLEMTGEKVVLEEEWRHIA